MAGVKESTYYQHSKSVPLASRLSFHVRQQIFRRFMTAFAPSAATSILDVGVTSVPCAAYRAILAKTSYRYWADEAHLNILSGNALRRMLPAGVKGQVGTVRLFGLSSNLIAFGDSQGAVG